MLSLADAMRRAYCEARGVTDHLDWEVLKQSEQEMWLETAHHFVQICFICGLKITYPPNIQGATC